jgi:hypothetical protein
MSQHPSCSQLLKELSQEHLNLAWLIGRLEQRSFGLLRLILELSRVGTGIATFTAFLLAFPAAQMMLGRESAHSSEFPCRSVHSSTALWPTDCENHSAVRAYGDADSTAVANAIPSNETRSWSDSPAPHGNCCY